MEKEQQKTFDLTPSCVAVTKICLLILRNTYSCSDDRDIAVAELEKIAMLADKYNKSLIKI